MIVLEYQKMNDRRERPPFLPLPPCLWLTTSGHLLAVSRFQYQLVAWLSAFLPSWGPGICIIGGFPDISDVGLGWNSTELDAVWSQHM